MSRRKYDIAELGRQLASEAHDAPLPPADPRFPPQRGLKGKKCGRCQELYVVRPPMAVGCPHCLGKAFNRLMDAIEGVKR